MPGPPPKHPDHRARRNATFAMTQLPAEGRKGRAPKWPLGPDVDLQVQLELAEHAMRAAQVEVDEASTARIRAAARKRLLTAQKRRTHASLMIKAQARTENELWLELWKTPQATQWEKNHWTRDVAQYVRHKAKAEAGSLDDAKEARMQADRLGLTPLALLRLRWEIVEAPAKSQTTPTRRSKSNSSKYSKLRVVG